MFFDFSTFYLRPITAANSAMQGKACTGITTKRYLRVHGLKATATAKAPTGHGTVHMVFTACNDDVKRDTSFRTNAVYKEKTDKGRVVSRTRIK